MAKTARALQRIPRPWLAVDTAVLTMTDSGDGPELAVVQVRREGGGGWCLPGSVVEDGERLADAVTRSLRDKAGLTGVRARQLVVLDDPGRDDRGRVVSVGHVAVLTDATKAAEGPDGGESGDVRLVSAASPGRLPWGQGEVVTRAVADLRARYREAPDPDGFLPATFTLRELRTVHELVAGEELQRDTFRRAMEPALRPTREVVLGGRGRPAELFRRS